MNRAGVTVLLCLTGLSLAGCASSMRSYLEKDTPTENLNARQDLTMPPDLRLPPPGTTAAAPDSGVPNARAATQTASLTTPPSDVPVYNPSATAPLAAAPKAAPVATRKVATPAAPPASNGIDSVYTNAGISLNNPDGTRKTDAQLREELQAYYIAQKKAKNPSYGTVFNMGNIFKDQ